MTGSLDLIDEHAHGWTLSALEGELKMAKYAGAAASSRLRAKYAGADVAITSSQGGGTYKVVDDDDSTLEFAPEPTIADVVDRYGAPIHPMCLVEKIDRTTVVLRSRLPGVTSSDAHSSITAAPRLRAGAQSNAGAVLPGGAAYSVGPLLAAQAYTVNLTASAGAWSDVQAAVLAVRVGYTEDETDVFAARATPQSVSWVRDPPGGTVATASFVVAASPVERERVTVAFDLEDGYKQVKFEFEFAGAGTLVHIAAPALARAVGQTQFWDAAGFSIPTNDPLVALYVRPPDQEQYPRAGFRECAPNVAITGEVVALPPCLKAVGGDKLRVRRYMSYAEAVGAFTTTLLDYENDVRPVGASYSEDGRAVVLSAPSSVALPTVRVPLAAHAAPTRAARGRFSVAADSGSLRVHLTDPAGNCAPDANFTLTAKVLHAGSAVDPANADAHVLETQANVSFGTVVFDAVIEDMSNVVGIVLDVSGDCANAVHFRPRINGHDLLGPAQQVFALGAEFGANLELDNANALLAAGVLDVGATRLYEYDGNLTGDALYLGAANVSGSFATGAKLSLGGVTLFEDHVNTLSVDQKLFIDANLVVGGREIGIADDGNALVVDDGALTVHRNEYTSFHGGSTQFVEANGVPALLMNDTLTFDGSSMYILGSNSSIAFVGSFTGAHVCFPAHGWRGSHLMKPAAVGMLVSSSGVHSDTGNINATHALPFVEVTSKRKDRAVFGVCATALFPGQSSPQTGGGLLVVEHKPRTPEEDEARVIVASVGEGALWVLDTNGDIENGDMLQSSRHQGFAERQDAHPEFGDGVVTNYTVGKSTTIIDWNGAQHPQTPVGAKSAFIGVVLHCG